MPAERAAGKFRAIDGQRLGAAALHPEATPAGSRSHVEDGERALDHLAIRQQEFWEAHRAEVS
jgi:hypothetical protein